MLGRSKSATTTSGSRMCNWRVMSACTGGAAVAVSASTGGRPVAAMTSARRRYSGRKSWPHSLTRWASSTATNVTGRGLPTTAASVSALASCSGPSITKSAAPSCNAASAASRSAWCCVELSITARTESRAIDRSWSRCSAMSGDTTTVRPPSARPATW
jgi:hypothetical protein